MPVHLGTDYSLWRYSISYWRSYCVWLIMITHSEFTDGMQGVNYYWVLVSLLISRNNSCTYAMNLPLLTFGNKCDWCQNSINIPQNCRNVIFLLAMPVGHIYKALNYYCSQYCHSSGNNNSNIWDHPLLAALYVSPIWCEFLNQC